MNQKSSSAFLEWLDNILRQKNMTDYQLAKRAEISHSVLSKARAGMQSIGWDACTAIATALEIPQSEVLIMAGHLEKPPKYVPGQAEWDALYEKLSVEDREELIAMARLKTERRRGKK